MARDVNRDDLFASKVPLKIRRDERRDETTARGVDVDRDINTTFDQNVIDSLDVLIFPYMTIRLETRVELTERSYRCKWSRG